MTATQTPAVAARTALRSNVVQQLVLALLFASLATGRANGHVLSGAAITGIVAVGAATAAVVAWTINLYSGSFAVLTGAVTIDASDHDVADPFSARSLWTTTLLWALGAAAWAAAGAGIMAAVLNGRVARFATVFVAIAVFSGIANVAISDAARRRGFAAATVTPTVVSPLRRRAWRQIAFPFAVTQGILNGGVAWVLFHDYATGSASATNALTKQVALADALMFVLPLTLVFGGLTRYLGAVDAASGRVVLDDPETQTVPKRSPIGMQFAVYVVIFGLALAKLAGYVLADRPSLGAVIATRAAISVVIAFVAAGIGYVRGAVNGVRDSEVVK
jgi:hypothetical protein